MEYTINLPGAQVIAILQLLEQVPMPLHQSLPIYQGIKAQVAEQDAAAK